MAEKGNAVINLREIIMIRRQCYICRRAEEEVNGVLIPFETKIGKLYRCSNITECRKKSDEQINELLQFMKPQATTSVDSPSGL